MRLNALQHATMKIRAETQLTHRRHKVSTGTNCPPIYQARAMKISTRKILNNKETTMRTWTTLDQFCRAFSLNIRGVIRAKYRCRITCPAKRQNTCPLRNWRRPSIRVVSVMRNSRTSHIWMNTVVKPVTISVIYQNVPISSSILQWRCRYIEHKYTVPRSRRT